MNIFEQMLDEYAQRYACLEFDEKAQHLKPITKGTVMAAELDLLRNMYIEQRKPQIIRERVEAMFRTIERVTALEESMHKVTASNDNRLANFVESIESIERTLVSQNRSIGVLERAVSNLGDSSADT